MSTATALLVVLAGTLPALTLAAWRTRRLVRYRRAVRQKNSTVVAACAHMSLSAGGAFTSFTCGTCGPVHLARTYFHPWWP